MRRKVQGHVELGAIVLTDGSVGPVRLTTFLDPDLDQSAVAAVSQWRFKPATRDGQPIPMRVSIDLEFKLR
jgi:TonB family protein